MSTKQLWDACRHLPCGYCHAESGEYCFLEVNGHRYSKHIPCQVRLAASAAGGNQ